MKIFCCCRSTVSFPIIAHALRLQCVRKGNECYLLRYTSVMWPSVKVNYRHLHRTL